MKKRYFSINKLEDGRWSVENLEQIELTKADIKAIYSIVLMWLRIRMGLLKGGEKDDSDSNKIKNQKRN